MEYKIPLLGKQYSNIYLYVRLFHYIWIFISFYGGGYLLKHEFN